MQSVAKTCPAVGDAEKLRLAPQRRIVFENRERQVEAGQAAQKRQSARPVQDEPLSAGAERARRQLRVLDFG